MPVVCAKMYEMKTKYDKITIINQIPDKMLQYPPGYSRESHIAVPKYEWIHGYWNADGIIVLRIRHIC